MARRISPELRTEQFKFMVSAAREGLSANATLKALRDAGQGIGRTEGLALFRQAKAVQDNRVAAAGLEWNNPIPEGFGAPWPSRVRTDLSVSVKLLIRNHVTGEYDVINHRTYNAEGLTPGEAIQNAYDAYSDHPYSDQFSIRSAWIDNVIQHVLSEV